MRITTKKLTTLGLLVGTSIALSRMVPVIVPFAGVQALRISFGQVPVMLAGLLFGPAAGAITGALADLIGSNLFPIGPYFPGFTLSYAVFGFLPVLIWRQFPRHKAGYWTLFLAVFITSLGVSVLNTIWLAMLSHRAVLVLLPPRLLGSLLQVPLHTLILHYSLQGYEAYSRSLSRQSS
ncbi:MAG: folate family ECF transporter S component [Firmicutes bacterium]|nr:folate family ECF transporter S component [Bacillota bacterium]